jgi:glycosyltransferase involved in cell wall biosynthesis
MLSIIIPASNEEALIGRCLAAVLGSTSVEVAQIVVVANGCQDRTAEIARGFQTAAEARGWVLCVLDLPQGGKMGALNAGDAAATHPMRAYLDADVEVEPELIGQICAALTRPEPSYASGRVHIAPAQSRISRAYARIYAKVPFMTQGVPGCGLFAVNGPGRARWGDFPAIISDDTFVRLCFAPEERIGVEAGYLWPIVEGGRNLLKVRRRQDAGVAEIAALYPLLLANDDKPRFGLRRALALAVHDPIGFAVYASIGFLARLGRSRVQGQWSRGR